MRFLCLCISFYVCLSTTHADSTTISGQVPVYNQLEKKIVAVLVLKDMIRGSRQLSRVVNAEGTFTFTFLLKHTQDVFLKVGDVEMSLLMHPSDHLQLEWTKAPTDQDLSDVTFRGNGAHRNRVFSQMMKDHSDSIDWGSDHVMFMGSKFRSLSPIEFQDYRTKKQVEQRKHLESYVKDHRISDSLILTWIPYFIKFHAAGNLLEYPLLYPMLNGKKVDEFTIDPSYYHFMDSVNTNDTTAQICSEYHSFLIQQLYIWKRRQAKATYDQVKPSENISIEFEYIANTTSGIIRDVLLTRFINEMMEMREAISDQVLPLADKYFELVENTSCREFTMENYTQRFSTSNIVTPPQLRTLNDSIEGNIIKSLVHQFPDRVIYIDIWATWCKPCILEMKYYPRLIKQFDEKDVVFIFLAAHSPETLWKKRVDELNLPGHHVLLSDAEYYGLSDAFELHGFPQHVVIGKNGVIVETRGASICTNTNDLNEEVVTFLTNLLKKNDH